MMKQVWLAAVFAVLATGPLAETVAPAVEAVPQVARGAVTNLPLPRYVTLKKSEVNARRGPGLTHRIDWVFKRAGMPLRITAEYEHWRRVEDASGEGGWVQYAMLSGARSVLVETDMAEFRDAADMAAEVAFQAERGVIGRLLECGLDWCRVSVEGNKGWVRKRDLWGVEPDEVVE
jgi:SH3-like domain-containing protein